MGMLTRGELAWKAGVNPETVRFYERQGLLPEPVRSASGYRLYEPEDATRLHFIKRAQEIGFTLKDLSEMLNLDAVVRTDGGTAKLQIGRMISEAQAKIRDLERMKATLEQLVDECDSASPARGCPILDAFNA